jgi:hypothetical protein
MNDEAIDRAHDRIAASQQRLAVSASLLRQSARLLPDQPLVPTKRDRQSGWWANVLAAGNTRWLRELQEVANSLLSEAAEMRMTVQETRRLASSTRNRAREQREQASRRQRTLHERR